MSDHPVPPAAEGVRASFANQATPARQAAAALETPIDNARMAAKLHSWLVAEMLGGTLHDDGTIHLAGEDREILMFSAGRSQEAAEAANAAFLAYLRTVR